MLQDEPARLRHSIRGTINALKLGTSALDTGLNREETLEFIEYFEQAADRMVTLLDQYDALPEADILAHLAPPPTSAV